MLDRDVQTQEVPAPLAEPQQPSSTIWDPRTIGGMIGGALVAIGAIGPWVTTPLASVNGFDNGDGKFLALLGVTIGLGGLFVRRGYQVRLIIAGAVAVALAVYHYQHIEKAAAKVTFGDVQLAHTGWGIWLVGIGGIVLLVAAFLDGGQRSNDSTWEV